MKRLAILFLIALFLFTACGKQAQVVPPTVTDLPPTATPTKAPVPTPLQSLPPDPTADPFLFGTIGTGEIQTFALESVVNAVFSRTLDRFVAAGMVQEYQVTSVTVFPGSGGLLAEVTYNVRIHRPPWLADGGTQAD